MKLRKNILLCLCAVSAFAALCKWSHATTRYVAPGGGHQSPYTNWAMAANTLAAALTPAVNGDTIVVSNGLINPQRQHG